MRTGAGETLATYSAIADLVVVPFYHFCCVIVVLTCRTTHCGIWEKNDYSVVGLQ